ncbi:MAG: ABC transporter permease [bacterium]|nr:ABC transporter permease [bacterium]
MLRWLLFRLAWVPVTLLGITFVTFAMLRLAPVDRVELEIARKEQSGTFHNLEERERAILWLRIKHGLVDEETLEPVPIWRGYLNWLTNALTLKFTGANENDAAFWRRLGEAVPVSLWLGFLALLLALLVGVPLGTWLGMRSDSWADRSMSQLLFLVIGMPEFLLATLLLLGFAGAWFAWFPSNGLRSPGSGEWGLGSQLLDFAWHLVLPVLVMASSPAVLVTRFLRDSVARAVVSPSATYARALGLAPERLRWRLLRNGAAPLATLAGTLLPILVGGSIVVENLFSLDGVGHLAFRAVEDQEQAMVMALVLMTSVVTLLALIASDVLHRLVDPRVRIATGVTS